MREPTIMEIYQGDIRCDMLLFLKPVVNYILTSVIYFLAGIKDFELCNKKNPLHGTFNSMPIANWDLRCRFHNGPHINCKRLVAFLSW